MIQTQNIGYLGEKGDSRRNHGKGGTRTNGGLHIKKGEGPGTLDEAITKMEKLASKIFSEAKNWLRPGSKPRPW